MKPQVNNPMIVAISGYPVRVDQIREYLVEKDQRLVILENGMKISVSKTDGEMLTRVMNLKKPGRFVERSL